MALPACVLPPPRMRPQRRPAVSPQILTIPVGRISPMLFESTEDRALAYLEQHGASPLQEIAHGIDRGYYAARDAMHRLVAADRVEAIPGAMLRGPAGLSLGRAPQTYRLVEVAHG